MLLSLDLTGHYRAGVGPFRVYRAAWVLWIFWSLALMALYATAIRLHLTGGEERARLPKPAARPGFLWVAVMLVVLNGLSQYLGLKTESHSPGAAACHQAGAVHHVFRTASDHQYKDR